MLWLQINVNRQVYAQAGYFRVSVFVQGSINPFRVQTPDLKRVHRVQELKKKKENLMK